MKTIKKCCAILSMLLVCANWLQAQTVITPASSNNNQQCYIVKYYSDEPADITISGNGQSKTCSSATFCQKIICFDRAESNPRTGDVQCSVSINGGTPELYICTVTIWPRIVSQPECSELGIIANCSFTNYCNAASADPANITHLTVGVYDDDIVTDVTPLAWTSILSIIEWYDNNTGDFLHEGAWVTYDPSIDYRVEVTRWRADGTEILCTDEQWWSSNGNALAAPTHSPSSSSGRVGSPASSAPIIKVDSPVNYPNPFHNETTISFELEKDAVVTLTVTDILGKQIATLLSGKGLYKGTHQVVFNRNRYPAGIYYYTIQAGNDIKTYKMNILR